MISTKKTLIALAIGCTFASFANAEFVTVETIKDKTYDLDGHKALETLSGEVFNGTTVTTHDFNLDLKASNPGMTGVIYGTTLQGNGQRKLTLTNENGSVLNLGGTNTIMGYESVVITSKGVNAKGEHVYKGITGYGTVNINAQNIEINSEDDAIHYGGDNYGTLTIEGFKTLTLHGAGYAIQNAKSSYSEKLGSKKGAIILKGDKDSTITFISDNKAAIRSQGDWSDVQVTAGTVEIKGHGDILYGSGALAISTGQVSLKANKLTIANSADMTQKLDTSNAIYSTGGELIIEGLDPNSTPTLEVDGDIVLKSNAKADLVFNGENSSMSGLITATSNNSSISFTNSTWQAQGKSEIKFLTLRDAVITMDETGSEINVTKELKGTGAQFNMQAERVDGVMKASTFSAPKTDGFKARIDFKGVTTDDMNLTEFEEMSASSVEGVEAETYAPQGNINGDYHATVDTQGNVNGTQSENTKLFDFRGANAIALIQWRNQINHLTKRLGDLRASEGNYGAWARVYGKESKWGQGDNNIDMTSTAIEVGGDVRVNDWVIGGAFNYTDTDLDLVNGNGDSDMYGLAVYASKLFDCGSFVDLVGRYGYLKSDLKAGNMDVEVKNNAFSLSAEIGHHFTFAEKAYVEPQIELTYGYVPGDDITATNGVKIEQDDFHSLVTRVGARVGFDFPENAGTFYATASFNYDFLGDSDGSARDVLGNTATLDTDLGGAWWSYGIGAQFKVGQSGYAYGELERTAGGDVKNPWAFNVGYRFMF